MNATEQYGITGEALYSSWVRKYEEIAKRHKFDGSDISSELATLKAEVSGAIDKYLKKAAGRKKFGIVTVFIPIIMLACGVLTVSGDRAMISFISIVLPIYGFVSMKNCNKVVDAAIDFDAKYFDGEIIYHRKNG